MVRVEADGAGQLVTLEYSGEVGPAEMEQHLDEILHALTGMAPGFRLLVDLTGLRRMELACAPHVEEIMRACDERRIGTVVRVIPDPRKDIGFNIMSRFHYRPEVRLQAYDNRADAVASLLLSR